VIVLLFICYFHKLLYGTFNPLNLFCYFGFDQRS